MTVLEPYLQSIQRYTTVLKDSGTTVSGDELCQQVEERKQRLIDQGVTAEDCVALPMNKRFSDWLNLLALIELGSSILLLPSQQSVFPNWVSVQVVDATTLAVKRHLSPDTRLCGSADPLIGVLSSGSTGLPKTIWHRLSHFVESAQASNTLLPLAKDDVSLVSLPLNHVGGLGTLFRALVSGSRLSFGTRADDLSALQQQGISRLSLVPTQLFRLQGQGKPPANLSVLLGGAPMASELIRQARDNGWQLHRSYGLSEMASQVVTETDENCWQILPHAQVELFKDELVVSGRSLFLGYGAPAEVLTKNAPSEFATGDLARWQSPHFEFIGRKDNRFVCGGENVQPESIERQFTDAFNLQQCLVVPVADKEWGDRVVLLIADNAKVNHRVLRAFSRDNLLPHERPVAFYWLPPQAGLKPSRQLLKEKVRQHDLETIR